MEQNRRGRKTTKRKPSEDESLTQKSKFKDSGSIKRKKSFSSENIEDRKRNQRKNTSKKNYSDNRIRLNRFISKAGICSRREADKFIEAGIVTINGIVVTELGTKVSPTDKVVFNNKPIKAEGNVYILLNKPKDYITTTYDPHAKRTVLDLVKNACDEKIYPVGRLDRNTTGVLLLTNDGDLTSRLTHPKYETLKIYHVGLDKNLKPSDLEKIAIGIELDDGFIKVDSIEYIDSKKHNEIGVEIHSGKNRIVRRIFESLGYKVVSLDRTFLGGLTKMGLSRGKWRILNEKEILMLKTGTYK